MPSHFFVLWIGAHARVVDSPAAHAEHLKAFAEVIEVAAVLLRHLDVEPAICTPWHATLGIEIPAPVRCPLTKGNDAEGTVILHVLSMTQTRLAPSL